MSTRQPLPTHDSAEEALGHLESANEARHLTGSRWIPERIFEGAAAVLIIGLAVFVTLTVILRYFGQGVLGTVELSAISMVVLTVLVIPAATAADENFVVEIVDLFKRPRLVDAARLLGAVVQVIVSLFLAFSALELLLYDWSTQTTMAGELSMPRYWLSLAVFLGFTLLVHASVLFLIRLVRTPASRRTDERV